MVQNSTQDPILDIRRNQSFRNLRECIESNPNSIKLLQILSEQLPPRFVHFAFPDVFGAVQRTNYQVNTMIDLLKNLASSNLAGHVVNQVITRDSRIQQAQKISAQILENLDYVSDAIPLTSLPIRTLQQRDKLTDLQCRILVPIMTFEICISCLTVFIVYNMSHGYLAHRRTTDGQFIAR